MSILIQLSVVFLGLLMFIVPMKYKLAILVFSFICLDAVEISFVKFKNSQNLLCVFFFLSELPKLSFVFQKLKGTIVLKLTILMFVATIILFIFSPHYHNLSGPAWLFIKEMVFKYLTLVYGFISIRKTKDIVPIQKVILVGMIILTLFGFLNLVVKSSPWLELVQPELIVRGDYRDFSMEERFRVQSMFLNPFCYGYVCLVCYIFFLYLYRVRMTSKVNFAIVTFCSLWGIVFCACRTLWVLLIFSVIIYYSFLLSKKKIIRAGFLLTILLLGIIVYMPDSVKTEFFEKLSQAFSTNTNQIASGGSSIGMRIVQFATVLYYIKGHYLFGLGKDYFSIDMGWGEGGLDTVVDEDLWGLEGVYLGLLLERGIVGLLFWIFFCIAILYFFYKNKKEFPEEASLGICILSSYVLFSCMTGELNSAYPSFLLIGVMMQFIINKCRDKFKSI